MVKRSRYYRIAMVQGAALVMAGLLSLLVGPLFRPPALANITSPNLRIVVGNLYDSFIMSFNQQSMVMIGVGVILACAPLGAHYAFQWYTRNKTK